MKKSDRKKKTAKRVLRLPDLDYAKRSVWNTLGSPASRRAYEFGIDDFVTGYCSEPRLAFSRTVVLRYRLELESRRLAPSSINLRLAAVRRLAYEAADTGLLSPGLAAGIRRVKGAKRVGVRLGNWLTAEHSRALLRAPDAQRLKGRRDRAMLALMLGCGLRRGEVGELRIDPLQHREDHRAIADLLGKAAHIRTVPVPDWVKSAVGEWVASAAITEGRLFRCVSRKESVWGTGITEKVIWHVVKAAAATAIQFLLGHVSVETTERYMGCKQRLRGAVNDHIGLEP